MAIANLHETILAYKMRKNQLNLEITELTSQKQLATYAQGDLNTSLMAEKNSLRNFFKDLYNEDQELQDKYLNYTEIPDFEEELDKITAKFEQELDELTAWETAIDAQITTNDTELQEIEAYLESTKSMLSTNIQEDFEFGLGG